MRGMEENQIAPRTALSTPTLILRQVQARITANHNELDELKKRHASTATLRYNSRAACVEKAISGDYTSCEQIAKDLGKPAEWVCKWLKRFIKKGISGLRNDAPRSGRHVPHFVCNGCGSTTLLPTPSFGKDRLH